MFIERCGSSSVVPGSVRKIVEVVFSFTNRNTDVIEKFFVRIDLNEEFPFVVTKFSPYDDL